MLIISTVAVLLVLTCHLGAIALAWRFDARCRLLARALLTARAQLAAVRELEDRYAERGDCISELIQERDTLLEEIRSRG